MLYYRRGTKILFLCVPYKIVDVIMMNMKKKPVKNKTMMFVCIGFDFCLVLHDLYIFDILIDQKQKNYIFLHKITCIYNMNLL